MADDIPKPVLQVNLLPPESRMMAQVITNLASTLMFPALRLPALMRAMAEDLEMMDKIDPCTCERCALIRKAAAAVNN